MAGGTSELVKRVVLVCPHDWDCGVTVTSTTPTASSEDFSSISKRFKASLEVLSFCLDLTV